MLRVLVTSFSGKTCFSRCQNSRVIAQTKLKEEFLMDWSPSYQCSFLMNSNALCRFIDGKTLHPDYKFSESGVYFAPSFDLLCEYQEYVNQLPINDDPEIFGMHHNAYLAFQASIEPKLFFFSLEHFGH